MPVIQSQNPADEHPQPSHRVRALLTGPLAAGALVAAGVWLSQGTLAPAGDGPARIGLLPLTPGTLTVVVAAGIAGARLRHRGAPAAPLWLVALAAIPWVPLPVPAAGLVWAGPLGAAAVTAALALMAWSIRPPLPPIRVGRQTLLAALLAAVVYAGAAWSVSPVLPAGDEPHYLIITQSLLRDHDLQIENNHRRGDYREYFAGDLPKPDYYRRGRNGAIYSVHAPGLAALVAPAFALGGYRAVELWLLTMAAAAAALAWRLAWRVTGRADAAWFGWAATVFAAPLLLNAFTVYPDGPGGLLVLTGVWALVRLRDERAAEASSAWPWLLHGAALALLPWLHTRFALLAGGCGALVLLGLGSVKNPVGKACAFLAVPTVSAVAWLAFFAAIYGTPDPAIPYRGSDLGAPAYIPGGLGGLFFDQIYGLFAVAPVLLAVPAGLLALLRRRGPFRFLPLELLFVAVPYALTVTHFAMWWGGYTSPARFLVPLLPAMAIPAAAAWAAATRRGTRAFLLSFLALSAGISAVLVLADRGRLAYVARDVVRAPWAAWLSPLVDLGHAAPAFFARVDRGWPGALFFAEIAVWLAALGLAWLAVRRVGEQRLHSAARLGTATLLALAAAGSAAATLVWTMEEVSGRTPGRAALELLRQDGRTARGIALDVTAARPLARAALPSRLSLRFPIEPRTAGAGRAGAPLLTVPLVPAGVYRLRIEPAGTPGWVMTGVANDQFALLTEPAARYDGSIELRLPVDVRALVLKGDEEARAAATGLVLEPQRLATAAKRIDAEAARRAVKYEGANVFFLDNRAFPEPGGFWVGGARTAALVLQPERPSTSVPLRVRNGPVDNSVVFRSGAWEHAAPLTADEELFVEIPIDPARGAAAVEVEVASGFRPAAVEPESRDSRFLGVWISPFRR
jgi:hypothetical protein